MIGGSRNRANAGQVRVALERKRSRMTLEQMRDAFNAQPFVPFVLHLADGRGIRIRSREFVMGAPVGRTITVHQPEGEMNVVDILLVTDLEFESTTSGSGATSEPSSPW
jgi:hypothetical protein